MSYQYNPLLLQEGPLGNFIDQTVDFAKHNGQKLSHGKIQKERDHMAKVLRSIHSVDPDIARFTRDAIVEKGQRNLNTAKAFTKALKKKVKATKPIKLSQIGKKLGRKSVLRH